MRAVVMVAALAACGGDETGLGDYAGAYLGTLSAIGDAPQMCGFVDVYCLDANGAESTIDIDSGRVTGACEGTIDVHDLQAIEPIVQGEERNTVRVSFDVTYFNVRLTGTDLPGLILRATGSTFLIGNIGPAGLAGDEKPVRVSAMAADGSTCEVEHPYLLRGELQL